MLEKTTVLDHGYVEYLGHLGSDQGICEAAWTSTEGAIKKRSPVPQFLDYLIRHNHASPVEFATLQVRIKAPLFVVQQLLRHRTFSANQVSGRYTELPKEVYTPEVWRKGGVGHNKQGSQGEVDDPEETADAYECFKLDAAAGYDALAELGVAPELARLVTPQGQYTELVVTGNLRNWLHFLNLRLKPNAQEEMRVYAQAIEVIVADLFPHTHAAWANHVRDAVTFSADELAVLRSALQGAMVGDASVGQALDYGATESGLRKSRQDELRAKLGRLL